MVESSVTESKIAAIRLPLTHHQYPTTSKVRKDSHDILVTLESVHDLYMPFWSYLVHPPNIFKPLPLRQLLWLHYDPHPDPSHLLQPNGNDGTWAFPYHQIGLSLHSSTSLGHLQSSRTCHRRISMNGRKGKGCLGVYA